MVLSCVWRRRTEETDSAKANESEVVQLREKVADLQELVSTERRRKESCQGEIERLSRQVHVAEDKASHWEEAARELRSPKHRQRRKGSRDDSSDITVGTDDVAISDGVIELRVQMAELKGRNSELHNRVVSLEHERQVLTKGLDEKNIVIEALQKELVASKISLVSVKSPLLFGSQQAVSSRLSVLSQSQASSPQHAAMASSHALAVPPPTVRSTPPAPLSSDPVPHPPTPSSSSPHDAAALQEHLLLVLKELRSKEEALGKCQEELEQFRRKFSVIIHQQVRPTEVLAQCECT